MMPLNRNPVYHLRAGQKCFLGFQVQHVKAVSFYCHCIYIGCTFNSIFFGWHRSRRGKWEPPWDFPGTRLKREPTLFWVMQKVQLEIITLLQLLAIKANSTKCAERMFSISILLHGVMDVQHLGVFIYHSYCSTKRSSGNCQTIHDLYTQKCIGCERVGHKKYNT